MVEGKESMKQGEGLLSLTLLLLATSLRESFDSNNKQPLRALFQTTKSLNK